MLHELLLALGGHHGDVFVHREGKIKVMMSLTSIIAHIQTRLKTFLVCFKYFEVHCTMLLHDPLFGRSNVES